MPLTSNSCQKGLLRAFGVDLSVRTANADIKSYPYGDLAVDQVQTMPRQANGDACERAGNHAFAECPGTKKTELRIGSAISGEITEHFAAFLGAISGSEANRMSRYTQAGGSCANQDRGEHPRVPAYLAAYSAAGDGKRYSWECSGFGSDNTVCDFGAFVLSKHDLPVVDTYMGASAISITPKVCASRKLGPR